MPAIHHVTAIAGDAQRNVSFYVGVLGLRLVKRTVNFDDPLTYHLYYGDDDGSPGSLVTFFAWPDGAPGQIGSGQVAGIAFAVSSAALGFWIQRLLRFGVRYEGPERRDGVAAGERVLTFRDHDGLLLQIVASEAADARTPAAAPGIGAEHGIRGLHGVSLWSESDATGRTLTDVLRLRPVGEYEATQRYAGADGLPGSIVDLRSAAGFVGGVEGVGTVHHVAWTAEGQADQLELRERAVTSGLAPTPVIDRYYFQSVYFRDPGQILFESATTAPGFTVDEASGDLGSRFVLPPQLEASRERIMARLPTLELPGR
jgi:glyoxalase family protein